MQDQLFHMFVQFFQSSHWCNMVCVKSLHFDIMWRDMERGTKFLKHSVVWHGRYP